MGKLSEMVGSEMGGSGGAHSNTGDVWSSTGDAWTDEQLDKWITAKRAKDFATADAIREELRAWGVDPDAARPSGWSADKKYKGGGQAQLNKAKSDQKVWV